MFDLSHHSVDRKTRVGTVPDIVTKEDEATDAAAPCVLEARLERLAVCVNVAKQADPHPIRSRRHAEFRRVVLDLIVDNGVDLPQRVLNDDSSTVNSDI
jgi:hypothetical protein